MNRKQRVTGFRGVGVPGFAGCVKTAMYLVHEGRWVVPRWGQLCGVTELLTRETTLLGPLSLPLPRAASSFLIHAFPDPNPGDLHPPRLHFNCCFHREFCPQLSAWLAPYYSSDLSSNVTSSLPAHFRGLSQGLPSLSCCFLSYRL